MEVLYGAWYAKNYEKWIIENAKHLDYVYINRPHVTIKYLDLLKTRTKAKLIYQSVDLHYLREMRDYEISKDSESLRKSEYWKQIEFEIFDAVDELAMFSSHEQALVQDIIPDKKITQIPLFFYDKIFEADYDPLKREGRAFCRWIQSQAEWRRRQMVV